MASVSRSHVLLLYQGNGRNAVPNPARNLELHSLRSAEQVFVLFLGFPVSLIALR